MPYQWLYNPIIKIHKYYRVCHRNIGKCYKNVKYLPQSRSVSVTIKASWAVDFSLGQILERQKCNKLVITQAIMLCLIHAIALRCCVPLGIVRIYQTKYSCLCYNLYIFIYIYICLCVYVYKIVYCIHIYIYH